MQNQAKVGGHEGQGSQAVNNGFPLSRRSSAACRKPWHKDDDAHLRREIFYRIIQLVQKSGLEKNVLEIAKDVEMALYLDAGSKEEYGDFQTLEMRLISLMLRLRNSQKSVQQGAQLGNIGMSNAVQVVGNKEGINNASSVYGGTSSLEQGLVQTYPQYPHHVRQQSLNGFIGTDGSAINSIDVLAAADKANLVEEDLDEEKDHPSEQA